MENIKDELQFYSKFTRPLIFNLPDAKDRVRAAGWVKKIRGDEAGSERLKTDYIKLLLFALQRKKLVGIFADDPDNYEKLDEFPPDFDLNSMAKTLIQKEQSERVDRIRKQLRGQTGDYPPYTTDCSSDFREYAAAQDIPGFGVHCYYAFSREPVNLWQRADRGIYPKLTKSAVDATSPLPPGVSGRTSDPSCVCPPAPGQADSPCSARAKKPKDPSKKKRQKKKLGKSPPTHPLGTTPPAEERVPPTWSSNLMDVRDQEDKEGAKPARSTGAIPKIRGEKQKKSRPQDDSDAEDAELKEMEEALEDYLSGEIKTRRRRLRSKKVEPPKEESDENIREEIVPPKEYTDEKFDDLDQSKFQEELEEDSVLLEHFKEKLSQAETKRTLSERRKYVGSASPAGVGIPLTTPKSSPTPKRQKSSEKLYTEEPPQQQADAVQPPPVVAPKKRIASRLKAPKVYKLFQDASAMPEKEKEKEKEVTVKHEEKKKEIPKLPADADKKTPEFEGKPMTPILKGSPQANAVFFDAIDTMEHAGPGTPPIFSQDPKVRERAQMKEYGAHLHEGVEKWVPGPEFFADKTDFVPYDPREERRHLDQMFSQADHSGGPLFDEPFEFPQSPEPMTEDNFGLPQVVKVADLPPLPSPKFQTPYRFTKPKVPTDAHLFDITEAEMNLVGSDLTPTTPKYSESPGVAGYVTPERLKMPKRETPPSYVPTAFKPIPSPGEMMSPPLVSGDDFLLGQESPPPQWDSPTGVNMLTVEEMTHGDGGIVSGLPSENIYGVKAADHSAVSSMMANQEKYIDFLFEEDDKMKSLMKGISTIDTGADLFGETMPDMSDLPSEISQGAAQVPSPSGRSASMFPEYEEPYVTGTQRLEARLAARRGTPGPQIQAPATPMTGVKRLEARMAARKTAEPATPRPPSPARPPGPMYFPPQIQSDVQYPQLSPDLHKQLGDLEYDKEFFDPSRGGSQSRFLIVGKTATRMKDVFKKFAPGEGHMIAEDPNEPSMSPRGYGGPVTPQRPPPMRTPPAPCGRGTPRSPPRAPSPEGLFDKPYIPPMYVSPGAGIMAESPPIIREDELDIRRDLVLDETKEPLALTMKEVMRRKRMKTAAAYEDVDRALGRAPPRQRQFTPSPPRIAQEQAGMRPPDQSTLLQPIGGTPRAERKMALPRREPCGGQRPRQSRLTEGAMRRRLDFGAPDPTETDTDKYIAQISGRHNLPPLSPPERSPCQPSIMDTWVPGNLPSPLKPPVALPGWKTPPRYVEKIKTPPPFRAELPAVHQDHWFFDRPDEPLLAPSPEPFNEYIDYDFETTQYPEDELFFGDEGPPSLASSGELSPSTFQSVVCPGSTSPMISPQRPVMSPRMQETPRRAESPQRVETPRREETPRRPSPRDSPQSPVTTPIRYFDLDLFTPPCGAGARTPVTEAGMIFREAGIIDSPIPIMDIPPTPPPPPSPYSPLSDPAEMQRMMERVRGAEGSRGIKRMMAGEAEAQPVQEISRPANERMAELRSVIDRRRKGDRKRDLMVERREERDRRSKPSMPRIQEYVSPVPYSDPHGLPRVLRVPGPSSFTDSYVPPKKGRAPPRRKVDKSKSDEMQQVIDDIMAGRLAHLDAIQVEEDMSPALPPPPQVALDFTTPEHLKVKPMSPIRKMQPGFTIPAITQEQLRRTPPAQLWDRTVAQTGEDFGAESMEFPPSPGQMSPARTPPCRPPARTGTLAPRQLFPAGPSPQESPGRTPRGTTPRNMLFDESFSEGLMSPEALAPTESQDRLVTHRASQRRIITTMLPPPNISPGSPGAGNLSDSFLAEDESNFKWMD